MNQFTESTLGHVNFKTINKLVKENLVRGLPLKRFENDQTCVACLKGKQHKASCKSETQNSITQPLFMLHMDLFGPTFISSLMNKKYYLVVIDDYSRFTWVFFLASKDETSGILKSFITEIKNLVAKKVTIVICNNGTEFKNRVMSEFCEQKGIKREFNIARTPQQNSVTERRNGTLIEVARTMLPDSKLPTIFWAEAVNIACYVQNKSFMRPLGCHVTILNTLDYLGKFDGKSDEGFFIGYSMNSEGPKWLFDIDVLTKSINYVPVVAGTNSNEFVDGSLFDSSLKNTSNDEPQPSSDAGKKDDEGSGVRTRRMTKTTNEQGFISVVYEGKTHEDLHTCLFACFLSQEELKKVIKALKRSLSLDSTMARRSFLQLSSKQQDLKIRVYKVEKVLYGLHQAPRAWYETLSTYLLDNRFQRGQIDKTLFIKRVKSNILFVQVYVDDIIFRSTKKELCNKFEKLMHKKFQMSSMGELTFFLGLQVTQKDDRIFISQDKYVDEILKKFGFTTVKTASTPMETSKPLIKDEEAEDTDVHLYRLMIGSLMYLTASRPDIMFAICACAKFQVMPKVSHLHAMKRIFRYLKGLPKLGLWYPKDSPFDLEDYTNSDYASANETVIKEWKDIMERATTTSSSLEVKQDSGNINRTQSMATLNESFPQGTGSVLVHAARHSLTAVRHKLMLLGITYYCSKKQPRRKQRKDTKVPQPSSSTEPITDEAANEKHVPIHSNDLQLCESSEDEGLVAQDDAFKQGRKIADLDADAESRGWNRARTKRIKKQKIDDDQEEAKIKNHMEIVVGEEEIAVDAIPLATKPPIIVDWKIIKEGKMGYFQIIRANGSSRKVLIND
ncbi:putative ribonuclease H-like domain-containing protein [Tanacetum coccineum]